LPWAEHGLRHDVDAALEQLHVEALLLVEALVDGGDVAGELGLVEPLQLQLDRGEGPPLARAGVVEPRRRCRSRQSSDSQRR
jgi:hypothetical protein